MPRFSGFHLFLLSTLCTMAWRHDPAIMRRTVDIKVSGFPAGTLAPDIAKAIVDCYVEEPVKVVAV